MVVSLGKAAASMAAFVESQWLGPLTGIAITRVGYERPLSRVELLLGTHPIPGQSSVLAARRAVAIVSNLTSSDVVLALVSGGASSLVALPNEPLTIESKARITAQLLRSGARIQEINTVRRHLSQIKGGRLALAAAPARVVTLAISDVVGDAPSDIGSGPTVPDRTTAGEALEICQAYGVYVEPSVIRETAKSGDRRFIGAEYKMVANGALAVRAAAAAAASAGFEPIVIGEALEGEASDVGAAHARVALAYRAQRRRVALISGGELTTTVVGHGRGGPNQEYVLGLILALGATDGIAGFAIDTDGVDGTHDVAGAWFDEHSRRKAEAKQLDARMALATNDSGSYFDAIGSLCITGPTGTNVNDLRVILVF